MKFNSTKFLVIRQTVLTMIEPIQILKVAEVDRDCSLILFKASIRCQEIQVSLLCCGSRWVRTWILYTFTSISCSCSWFVAYICCKDSSSSVLRSRSVFPSSAARWRSKRNHICTQVLEPKYHLILKCFDQTLEVVFYCCCNCSNLFPVPKKKVSLHISGTFMYHL